MPTMPPFWTISVNPATAADTAYRLKRLLFRMLGIYHGASFNQPASLDFSGAWLPDSHYLQASERILGYETASLTFMDIYFVNANNDLMDVHHLFTGVGPWRGKTRRSSGPLLRLPEAQRPVRSS